MFDYSELQWVVTSVLAVAIARLFVFGSSNGSPRRRQSSSNQDSPLVMIIPSSEPEAIASSFAESASSVEGSSSSSATRRGGPISPPRGAGRPVSRSQQARRPQPVAPLPCAHCTERALYESVLGEWVCELHEAEAFSLRDGASDDGATTTASPSVVTNGGAASGAGRTNDGGAGRKVDVHSSCAHCIERPVCENIFGDLVCGLHEAMAFSLIDDDTTFTVGATSGGANAADGTTTSGSNGASGAREGTMGTTTTTETSATFDSRCVLCDGEMPESAAPGRALKGGGRCASGHTLCAACTAKYVEQTLLPRGTVWWDRIDCVDTECTERMSGVSVQRCISDELAKRVEVGQFDAGHLICGDRDPSSEAAVAKFTRPCPNCSAPTEKYRGCDHMHCTMCGFHYWWSCTCAHPGHSVPCVRR